MPGTVRADLAVILAAGGGVRMGIPKGLLELAGRVLALQHVDALEKFATETVVVVGAQAAAHRAELGAGRCIENPEWRTTWPADSLRLALLAHPHARTCLVQPVDTPPATTETIVALLAAGAPAVPTGPDGRPGHPVLLGPVLVDTVRRAAPDGGLRSLLADAPRIRVTQVDVAHDFDEPEDWASFCRGTGDG